MIKNIYFYCDKVEQEVLIKQRYNKIKVLGSKNSKPRRGSHTCSYDYDNSCSFISDCPYCDHGDSHEN